MSLLTQGSSASVTRAILGITVAHLVIGIFVHAKWLASGDLHILRLYFDYEGAFVFLLFSTFQLFFATSAYRAFSSHQPLGTAWFYIMLASVCGFVGTVFTKLLAVDSALNPVNYVASGALDSVRVLLGNVGTVIGGPIQMILFGAGLYLAIRVYRQLGMLARLKVTDKILIGATMFYACIVVIGIVQAVRSHPDGVTAERALTWPGDYLLSLLLLEAIILRRAAVEMGWGFVSKVWGAFAAAIFLTSFCSLMNWLTAYGIFDWTHTAFVWYLWYPASAAFALAPAYQWEATRTAKIRLATKVEELELPA